MRRQNVAGYKRSCTDIFWHLLFSPAGFSPTFPKPSSKVRVCESR